ncbi:NAD binding domain of 6-phosphogluconate dehydrogenase-domain-containing protein [Phyllosticta capitalensis]
MAPTVAWIGLGNMGRGMCRNLSAKGNLDNLVIYNRTKKRADDLAAQLAPAKSTVASSVQEAVQSADIIFTCLGDDKAVNDTIDAALQQDVKGKLFVECSTVHPETTNALAERITAKGAEFVASPVFGPPAMADAGELIFVLAGPAKSVEKVKPYATGVMGKSIIDFSDQQPGKASLLKVIGNTFVFQMIETLAEGHVLAEKSGLGGPQLHQFVEAVFPGPYTSYSERIQQGEYYKREEPLFSVDLARKDTKHALKLAEDSGTKMAALEVVDKHFADVQEYAGSKGDVAAIYGAVRLESGLKYEN